MFSVLFQRVKKRGFAVPIVLVSITLIISIVVGYSTSIQHHVLRTKKHIAEVEGQHAVRSGLALAVGSLLERLAAPEDVQQSVLVNGTPNYCRITKTTHLAYSIQDVSGRIDLNFASIKLLELYFSSLNLPQVDVREILREVLERRQIRPFAFKEELQNLKSINANLLRLTQADLTTFGVQDRLSLQSASEPLKRRLSGLPDTLLASSPSNRRYIIDVLAIMGATRGHYLNAVIEVRSGQTPLFNSLAWDEYSSSLQGDATEHLLLKEMPLMIPECTI